MYLCNLIGVQFLENVCGGLASSLIRRHKEAHFLAFHKVADPFPCSGGLLLAFGGQRDSAQRRISSGGIGGGGRGVEGPYFQSGV